MPTNYASPSPELVDLKAKLEAARESHKATKVEPSNASEFEEYLAQGKGFLASPLQAQKETAQRMVLEFIGKSSGVPILADKLIAIYQELK